MPTNFPTSVDNFTNPTANDSLNLPSHSTQHANANDAIEAVESYLLTEPMGLRLIKKQTIGSAVSLVTVTGAFSASYDNYKIMISGGAGTVGGTGAPFLFFTLGAASTGYYEARPRYAIGGSAQLFTTTNGGSFLVGGASPNGINANIELQNPFLSKNTLHNSGIVNPTTANIDMSYGYLNDTSSYTSFNFGPTAGTITGGTIYVYGYTI